VSRKGKRRQRWIVLGVLICCALVLGTAILPMSVSAERVSDHYIRYGVSETAALNLVSAVLLDYRSFDTLGEATVIFAAVSAVSVLMSGGGLSRNRRTLSNLARCAVANIYPVLWLFPLYVILHGHLSPGGGFHGGVTMGVLLIMISVLYGTAFSLPKLSLTALSYTEYSSALAFILVGLAGVVHGSGFLSNIGAGFFKGSPGDLVSAGFLPLLNVIIGFKVAAGLVSIYYQLLRSGD